MCSKNDLFLRAMREAQKHRYEKCKSDTNSDQVVEAWFGCNWAKFYRERWIEHLTGKKKWDDFPVEDFDVINNHEKDMDHNLVVRIISCLNKHNDNISENLGIVINAVDSGYNMREVLKILKKIDMNNKRKDLDNSRIKVFYKALEEADKYKWTESQKAGKDLGESCILSWFELHWKDFAKSNGLPEGTPPHL